MFIRLTNTLNGKMRTVLINVNNIIAIEDYWVYAMERNFRVNETLKEIEEKIEQITKGEE